MLIAAGLSLVLLSAILAQAVPAYTAQKNTRTVYAAQAGLQSGLAVLRSAVAMPDAEGRIFGDSSKLPCDLTGNVAADSSGPTYVVSLQYFSSDPTYMTAVWRDANKIYCHGSAGLATVPKYAYITSKGQDAAIPGVTSATLGNRALSAIYKFKITNVNIVGGMIFNSTNAFCIEAVSASAGQKIKFVPAAQCLNTSLQLWTYAADYELKLASSLVGGGPGLCITGPKNAGESAQDALLQTCKASPDATRWNQLWSWTGSSSWRGQNATNTDVSNYYLSPGTVAAGSFLRVNAGSSGSFSPSASVGAGAASYSTNQLVNYLEFGRCADVTAETWSKEFMISYPCKQDPTGGGANLLWNHKWYYTEPVSPATKSAVQDIHIYTEKEKINKKCLTAPATGAGDVTFAACNPALVRQQWVRVKDTGDYSTSYLVVNQGNCLTVDSANQYVEASGAKFSKVRVATCNGTLAQKWNAPPTYVDSTFGGYREVAG
ncbi:hypothetical protein [Leifsonia sp. A12D58]|uniref:hypothetical protein n=1 Tax=Leifsonia sp. A12D58 TaxID=3397674 RepID=UPI0039E1530F